MAFSTTNHNTDNIGHLFVTVFEHPAFLQHDSYIAPPGHRTNASNKGSVPRLIPGSVASL